MPKVAITANPGRPPWTPSRGMLVTSLTDPNRCWMIVEVNAVTVDLLHLETGVLIKSQGTIAIEPLQKGAVVTLTQA